MEDNNDFYNLIIDNLTIEDNYHIHESDIEHISNIKIMDIILLELEKKDYQKYQKVISYWRYRGTIYQIVNLKLVF